MNAEKFEKAKEKLSLALVAALNDLDSAKIIAETKGISFERNSVIALVREFLGEESAKKLEHKWPAEESDSDGIINSIKSAVKYSKEQYKKLTDFSQFTEVVREHFQNLAAQNTVALARGAADSAGASEIPEITYAIMGDDEDLSIMLRFKSEIPEALQHKEAYQVSLNDQPIEVEDISLYVSNNKVQLWLGANSSINSNCSCAIGYNPDANDSVGIFLSNE